MRWLDFDFVADGQETARGAQVRMDIAADAPENVRRTRWRGLWPNVESSNDPARGLVRRKLDQHGLR